MDGRFRNWDGLKSVIAALVPWYCESFQNRGFGKRTTKLEREKELFGQPVERQKFGWFETGLG